MRHGCVHMGQMDFIRSIFVNFFFQNYLGSISLITRYRCIGWSIPLFVHSTLILKQWRHWDQHVYSCTVWSCCLYQKAFRDKQCNFWPGFNVNVQPGQCFCSRLFSVKQITFEIYIILCEYLITVLFRILKIKINLVKLTFQTAFSSRQVMGMSLTKVWVMENIPRWIWSFSCNWLAENKRKWAGHGLSSSYTMGCPPVRGDNLTYRWTNMV